MSTIAIKVTVDADHIGMTDQMCQSLTQLGMVVESTFPEIGVIFGSADEALIPKMKEIEGVTEAVPERTMGVLPHD
jgi:hypothetical protein